MITNKIIDNISKVLVGKRKVIEKVIICLLSRGHLLIEDVPGVGKTTLAKALAKSLDLSFSRIQFTPDLLPTDILGVNIYDKNSGEFKFIKGPIHNQIVLADEINRTNPKTQSSLLEVMEENQITIDGTTFHLKKPFIVIATQNPVEYEGTFPLPEAQLDRFFMKISIGYPDRNSEINIISENKLEINKIKHVANEIDILNAQNEVDNVYVSQEIKEYIVEIIQSTRNDEKVLLGLSPRATISLFKASKANAFINERNYVTPKDVKNVAEFVLSHRIILKPEIKYKGITSNKYINELISKIKVPLEK